MSRNEDVTTAIWIDLMVLKNPDAKLLYLWSFTNESNNMAGLYKMHDELVMAQTSLSPERLRAAFNDLAEHRFVFCEDSVIWVRTRVKRLRSKSPKMAISIGNALRSIPDAHPLRVRFLEMYAAEPWLRPAKFGTPTEPVGNLSENAVPKGDSDRFPRTSLEVPGTGGGDKPLKKRDVSGSRGGKGGPGEKGDKTKLPVGFPERLRPHMRIVFPLLTDLAVRHNAKAVQPRSLATVAMAHAHKPLVAAAYGFVAWADDQPEPRRDVVSGYRNWLGKQSDLAGFEELGADGLPANGHHRRANASEMLRDLGFTDNDQVVDATAVEEP